MLKMILLFFIGLFSADEAVYGDQYCVLWLFGCFVFFFSASLIVSYIVKACNEFV